MGKNYAEAAANARPGGGGARLPEGRHTVKITKAFFKDGREGDYFIAEVVAQESTTVREGSEYSIVITLDDKFGYGVADMRGLIAAAIGIDPRGDRLDEVNQTVIEAAMYKGGVDGLSVGVKAYPKDKKLKAGETFIKLEYFPVTSTEAIVAAAQPSAPPPPPPAPAAFPPAGWTPYPNHPGYFYKGQDVLSEADLRARVGA